MLREFSLSDASNMCKLNKDLEVIKYTGDSLFATVKEAKLFLKNYTDYQKNGFGRWAILLKDPS